ncbi:MAG TPA: flagellar M-ring protein FliF C-terminal domain-containing protein [Phycisphaerales bacterium]|nr:flagellar M-ring protein FliF C-terminal domain-containing protein [Phycisphaerales bacterium]
MGQLRRAIAVIQTAAQKLTVSQKLLFGSLAVVLVMALFLVQQYTGKPAYVQLLPGATVAEQQEAVTFLAANSIPHKIDPDGSVTVSPGSRSSVLAQMTQQNKLPGDKRLLFDNLIDKQSWTLSQRQNAQLETIAVQNELASIITNMNGIRSARVILNLPERRSLGQPTTESSASATVFASRPLDQATVDSIAHLIAGSRGIDVKRVRVIDGTTNRQFRAREETTMAASSYLEYVTAVEDRKQSQLQSMLSSYIPGVIVTVHAQVDMTRRQQMKKNVLPEGKGSTTLLTSETTSDNQSSEPKSGGEPGPRSNTGQDIAGFSSGGSTSKQTTGENKFEAQFGVNTETIEDYRGNPTKINAVVNIPRGYFVDMWKKRQPAAGGGAPPAGGGTGGGGGSAPEPAEPSDTDLGEVVQSETTRIKREVLLQIDTSAGPDTRAGEVEVSMIPFVAMISGTEGGAAASSVLGLPLGPLAAESLTKTIGLGLLALISIGFVVITAAKASKRMPLPSAEELVGLPPTLDQHSDLIGEAGEADAALQGIELDDDEIKRRKMREQITELVTEKPQEAAGLVSKWISGMD